MKNVLLFLGGLLTGVVLTLFFAVVFASQVQNVEQGNSLGLLQENENVTMFDEPGEVVRCISYKVFQVLENNQALVRGNLHYEWYDGPVYLITNDDGKYYYDDEVIKVPKGKKMRQIGIFRYNTSALDKTVPIIKIMDK